jgi:hypothetical protein
MAYQDSLETCRNHFSLCSFGLGKNQRNRVSGKKLQRSIGFIFSFVLGMCAIVTYLFLAQ